MLWPAGRRMFVSLAVLLLTIPAMLPSATAQTTTPPPSPDAEALCVVNGAAITRANVNKAVQQQWGRQILEGLIEQKLVVQAAQAQGLSVSAEELNARMAVVKGEYESLEDFNRMMHDKGIKGPAFREQLRAKMLLGKLVETIGAVSEEQVRAHYDEHISDYQAPAQVHLHAIVAPDAEQAYHAREQVAHGADFDEVAGEAGSDVGGDWGWLVRDDLRNALIRETAFSLKAGDVSNPIFLEDEYYVLWVEEAKAGVDRSFEDTREEIARKIREEHGITAESVTAGLWRRAQITVPWKAYYYLEDEYEQLDVVKLFVGGSYVEMPVAPVILENGHMLVMAQPLLQAMSAQLTWDAETQTLSAVTEKGTVELTVGSLQAKSGDRVVLLNEVPQLRGGRLFVSPRPVVTALGGSVVWDPVDYALRVTAGE